MSFEHGWSNMFSQHAYGVSMCATRYGQRLTFHPSHFVKLATADEALLCKSLKELEVHSQVRACPRMHGRKLPSVERLCVGGPSHGPRDRLTTDCFLRRIHANSNSNIMICMHPCAESHAPVHMYIGAIGGVWQLMAWGETGKMSVSFL